MTVSIIITAYNYGRYLERCLRSCVSQNFSANKFEVIVVDDHSTDETPMVMENFLKGRQDLLPVVRYIRNEKNLGVAGSANEGIRAAQGQFVIRVDADDYVAPNMIFFLSEYLQANHDAFCVSCDYVYINEFEEKVERLYAEQKPVSCGIMYRKDVLIECGMYNADWRHREEEELRKRLGNRYKLHHLRMPFYRYRMHTSNKTKQLDMMEEFKNRLMDVRSDDLHINVEQETQTGNLDDYCVAVIPARGGSKRLERKNIYPVLGKPMLCWAIEAAQRSKYIKDVFVSTEDAEIAEVARKAGAKVIERPDILSGDRVYKQDVICHAARYIEEKFKAPTLVVSLQANSPQVRAEHIDQGIDHLIKYARQEVMSVDKNLNQDAAIRIMSRKALFQKTLSTSFGVFVADLHDVHTLDDVKKIENEK